MARTPKYTPKDKPSYLNFLMPANDWNELTVMAREDLRTRADTVLILIHEEYQRRYPHGAPVSRGSSSIQVVSDLDRG